MSNILVRMAVKKFAKAVIGTEDFGEIKFVLKSGNESKVTFAVDGDRIEGELTEEESKKLVKNIPFRDYDKLTGTITKEGMLIEVETMVDNEPFIEKFEI